MPEETIGTYKEISADMREAVMDITNRGNDVEIRKRKDGTYDVYELERRKRRPAKTKKATE